MWRTDSIPHCSVKIWGRGMNGNGYIIAFFPWLRLPVEGKDEHCMNFFFHTCLCCDCNNIEPNLSSVDHQVRGHGRDGEKVQFFVSSSLVSLKKIPLIRVWVVSMSGIWITTLLHLRSKFLSLQSLEPQQLSLKVTQYGLLLLPKKAIIECLCNPALWFLGAPGAKKNFGQRFQAATTPIARCWGTCEVVGMPPFYIVK